MLLLHGDRSFILYGYCLARNWPDLSSKKVEVYHKKPVFSYQKMDDNI
jgi:hypothetical protein